MVTALGRGRADPAHREAGDEVEQEQVAEAHRAVEPHGRFCRWGRGEGRDHTM
jgi:hypothetical protein